MSKDLHIHYASCGCSDESKTGTMDLFSLNESIIRDSIFCLNEHKLNSGKAVLSPFEDRFNGQYVSSDSDEEIIFQIRFDETIRLKGIIIHSLFKSQVPMNIKIFANPASDIDFGNVQDITPTYSGKVIYDPNANQPILFKNNRNLAEITHLAIYLGQHLFPQARSTDDVIIERNNPLNDSEADKEIQKQQLKDVGKGEIAVNWVGLLGNRVHSMRYAPKTTYEIAPQVGDHVTEQFTRQNLGFGL